MESEIQLYLHSGRLLCSWSIVCPNPPEYSISFLLEFYKNNPEPPTLTFVDFYDRVNCNFYVLGVVLRRMHFLMQFVFLDKDGSIKDYSQTVCEWLGKQDALEQISTEKEIERQTRKNELESLLYDFSECELSDMEFAPIRAAIIKAHTDTVPNNELKKRNNKYKLKMGDKALCNLLSKLGVQYLITSRRKNSGGKNDVQHTWTIKRL